MFSEKKLKNIASNLSQDFKGDQTPTSVYNYIIKIANKQSDYFIHYIGAENLLKIIIYCYSYVKTRDFKLADKIFKNISFVVLFDHEDEMAEKECNECNGGGYVACDNCSRDDAKIRCPTCNGESFFECEACDGIGADDEGEICTECYGSGIIGCKDCIDGLVNCDVCNGDGELMCGDCDGTGMIDTEEVYYKETYLILWNPQLVELAEKAYENDGWFLKVEDLIDYEDDYILVSTYSDDNKLQSWVEPFVYYPIDITDGPKNIWVTNQGLIWNANNNKLNEFFYE